MSNIVIIGAGQTGRGYLNRFFQAESITFLDKDEELFTHCRLSHVIMCLLDREQENRWNWRINNAYLIDSEDGLRAMADAV